MRQPEIICSSTPAKVCRRRRRRAYENARTLQMGFTVSTLVLENNISKLSASEAPVFCLFAVSAPGLQNTVQLDFSRNVPVTGTPPEV